ncbi:MAG: hypothetical protein MRY63_11545 [Neomegalonema sp.]|nr:hypothetical protein [Neomegalonema sp.]
MRIVLVVSALALVGVVHFGSQALETSSEAENGASAAPATAEQPQVQDTSRFSDQLLTNTFKVDRRLHGFIAPCTEAVTQVNAESKPSGLASLFEARLYTEPMPYPRLSCACMAGSLPPRATILQRPEEAMPYLRILLRGQDTPSALGKAVRKLQASGEVIDPFFIGQMLETLRRARDKCARQDVYDIVARKVPWLVRK